MWTAGQPTPPGQRPIVRSSGNSIAVVHSRGTDLYEQNPYTKRLYQTIADTELTDSDVWSVAKFPNSPMIAYSRARDRREVVFYDLATSRPVLEQRIDFAISLIRCAGKHVALTGYPNCGYANIRTVLYSWTPSGQLHLVKSLNGVRENDYRISTITGIVAYIDRERRLRFMDGYSMSGADGIPEHSIDPKAAAVSLEVGPSASKKARLEMIGAATTPRSHTGTTDVEICAVDVEIGEDLVCISACGRLVATEVEFGEKMGNGRTNQTRIAIYRRATMASDCSFEVPHGRDWTDGAFSDDSRLLVMKCGVRCLVYAIYVFDLCSKKLRYCRPPYELEFSDNVSIRKISDEYYVQFFMHGKALRVIKIDDSPNNWHLML